MTLDAAIDELYQEPPDEFVGARAALAKTLSGADAGRVRALKKPTIVPWAVNQVYWRARETFDRVRKTGAAVRREQVAALSKGRAKDLKPLLEAHRGAVATAVDKALAFARESQAQPSVDALSRTFEALSLATETPEPLGRFTQPLRPGGFEMLAGVTPSGARPKSGAAPTPSQQRRLEAEARQHEQEQKAADKRRAAAIAKAERHVADATTREREAHADWERARAEVDKARRSLDELKSA
jgi:hypothetical protein